ncbi:tyrosine-type recombinase/integrase [Halobellus marinus]|uniref:tyrosine-type recombinase/integrase n=1 Tax=Halobellus TaxID=1073986 RepID=UPI0028ACC5E5|nr:site-specific integrase [Halobellus sp. DFY28]
MRNEKGQFSSPDSKQLNEYTDLHQRFCEEFLARKDPPETTFETRKRESRYWLAWCEQNDVDPRDATEDDVKRYIKGIRNEKAGTTVSSYFNSIRVFYRELSESVDVDELDFDELPTSDLDIGEEYDISQTPEYVQVHKVEKESDIIAIEPDTIRELFDHVPGENPVTKLRNKVLLKLSWFTACRADELSRMEVDKINHDDYTIKIRSSKLNPDDHPDLYIRNVCYPADFDYQLRRWIKKRESYSRYADQSSHLFLTTHKPQMEPAHISDIVKEAAQNAGVQEPLRPANPARIPEDVDEWLITSHRVRRAAISHWVNNCDSIDLHQARRMAGHADIQRTMEYLEPDEEKLINNYQASF